MYKLIATDLDGTLLNDEGQIPKNTYGAVAYANSLGIRFVLCTGRPIQGVMKLYDDLKLDSPIVTNNGAMVYLNKNGPLILNQTMSIEDGSFVLKLNEEYKCTVCMWHDQKLYVSELNDQAYAYASITGIIPHLLGEIDLSKCMFGPTKFVFCDSLEKIASIRDKAANAVPDTVTAVTTRPYFLEFFSSSISKAFALMKIGEALDIRQEEMIAVGDGCNDMEMIRYAGLGVACANGDPAVKAEADYIACTNNEGAIADVIDKFIRK
ncbi:MAG: Cof-type HAD-IIB family hydrolase [Clostridia bacterium]